MSYIPAHLQRLVLRRSQGRCEYCHLAQNGQEATFHIDHVTPVAADGKTVADNLALACVSCSLRKGARQTAVDPETTTGTALFNPRRDIWLEHFAWQEVTLCGLTATGRATIAALELNRPTILAIRAEETFFGRHPA